MTTRSLAERPNVSGMYISSAFGGGTTKLPGRRRARDVAVLVDALPEQRRERLDALVAHVLVLVPGAVPPPVRDRATSARLRIRAGSGRSTASAGFIASRPAGSGSTSATW